MNQKLVNVRKIRFRICDPSRLCCLCTWHTLIPFSSRLTLKSQRNKKLWAIYEQGLQKLENKLDIYENIKQKYNKSEKTKYITQMTENLKLFSEVIIEMSSDNMDENYLEFD